MRDVEEEGEGRNKEAVVAVVTKKGEEGVDKDCEMR